MARISEKFKHFAIGLSVLLWLAIEFFVATFINQSFKSNELTFIINGIPTWISIISWLIFIGYFIHLGYRLFSKSIPNSTSLGIKRLLTNALGYKSLSIVFIFAFLIQTTCFFDLIYLILLAMPETLSELLPPLYKSILAFISIFIINSLFPYDTKPVEYNIPARDLLITPLSINKEFQITDFHIDLLLKPFNEVYKKGRYNDPDESLGFLGTKRLIIIGSNELSISTLNIDWKNISDDETSAKQIINEYNIATGDDKLVLLSKIIGKYIHQKYNRNISIEIHGGNDYEDFDNLYHNISRLLEHLEDDNTDRTAIHISPGVTVISCVLSTLSLKGNRLTLYTQQNGKNKDEVKLDDNYARQNKPIKGRVYATNLNRNTFAELLNELWNEMDS